MSANFTNKGQESAKEASEVVAKGIDQGKSNILIVKDLMKQGWPEESAINLVRESKRAIKQYEESIEQSIEQYKESPEGRRVTVSKYKRHMLFGLLWAAGGTAVTVGSAISAESGGGVYIIAWGAILFGIINFFVGLFGWLKYKN